MPDAPTIFANPVDERRLRKLLTSRKSADKAELEAWFAFMQPFDAAPLLAEVAKDVRSPTQVRQVWARVFVAQICLCILFAVLLHYLNHFVWEDRPASFPTGTIFSFVGVALFTYGQWRGGAEAALLLARTGDTRAVQILAKLWTPRPITRREIAFNADVSRELTRLLSARQGDRYDLTTEKVLRELLERAFPTPSKMAPLSRYLTQRRARTDLTETDADLLLGVVRHLSQPRQNVGDALPKTDIAAIERVARESVGSVPGQHRALLRDTAQALLTTRGTSV